MKEIELHRFWRSKKAGLYPLYLTSGRSLKVFNVGEYNEHESGPDFHNGEILIEGVRWVGNIEIHLKSSDWYVHQHHTDAAYNNVVLHVVFEHNIDVLIGDRILETLELKSIPEIRNLLEKANGRINQPKWACHTFLKSLDEIYMESMKERCIVDRLNKKSKEISLICNSEINYAQLLYTLLARAFGMHVNADPFHELTNRLPLKILKKENQEYVELLVLGVGGWDDCFSGTDLEKRRKDWVFFQNKYKLTLVPRHVWKQKGLRPAGFPKIRLKQFAKFVQNFDFNTNFIDLSPTELIEFLYSTFDLSATKKDEVVGQLNTKSGDIPLLSASTKDLIIINCIVPFLWWYGSFQDTKSVCQKALDVLINIAPEKNVRVAEWKKLGVRAKNAYDSQALLEIYNEFCCRKKCLNCVVGNKILNE
jgi:hypothetical protein